MTRNLIWLCHVVAYGTDTANVLWRMDAIAARMDSIIAASRARRSA